MNYNTKGASHSDSQDPRGRLLLSAALARGLWAASGKAARRSRLFPADAGQRPARRDGGRSSGPAPLPLLLRVAPCPTPVGSPPRTGASTSLAGPATARLRAHIGTEPMRLRPSSQAVTPCVPPSSVFGFDRFLPQHLSACTQGTFPALKAFWN